MDLIVKIYRIITRTIIDWFFPVECIVCGESGDWMCKCCLSVIELKPVNSCIFCHQFSFAGITCKKCKTEKFLEGVFCYNSYGNPIIKKIIYHYKYSFLKKLSDELSFMLGELIENIRVGQEVNSLPKIISAKTIFFSVPLHKRRLRERGFNQSSLLLEKLVANNVVDESCLGGGLTRVRYTRPQAKTMSRGDRGKNLNKAFLYNGQSLKNKNIILVDDVSTTGSTLNECARVLKSAGAKKVYGLVVARG